MSRLFLRIAVLWYVAGVTLGAAMGATHNFGDVHAHVHGNLLGWVSCALFALIHKQFPQLATTRTARLHFWGHNSGLVAFVVGLVLLPRGVPAAEPLLGVASVVLVVATAMFAVMVWKVPSVQSDPPSRSTVHAVSSEEGAPG